MSSQVAVLDILPGTPSPPLGPRVRLSWCMAGQVRSLNPVFYQMFGMNMDPHPSNILVLPVLACTSRKTSLKARPARSVAAKSKVPQTKVSETKARETKARTIKAPKTKAPEEIPPEAVQEYLNIMDELVGPTNFTTWEPSSLFTGELAANLGEEELEQQPIDDDLYPDPSLLSYIDEDFVKKVS